jgi:hypothetical protein
LIDEGAESVEELKELRGQYNSSVAGPSKL